MLEALTRRARKVLVATPWGFRRQEIPGMPFETHRSGWDPWDLSRRPGGNLAAVPGALFAVAAPAEAVAVAGAGERARRLKRPARGQATGGCA